jgi:hypothetical protein
MPKENQSSTRSHQSLPQGGGVELSLDELAKGLATGTLSRSKAIRWMGGALLGAALASLPGMAWANDCRRLGRECRRDSQCCSRNCVRWGDHKVCGCPEGKTRCNDRCVNLKTNENHCGRCSKRCAAGQECVAGVCQGGCPSGTTRCGTGGCLDLSTDNDNCGTCGNHCLDVGGICQNGECRCLDVCTPGYTCTSPPPGASDTYIPCCGRPGCSCFTTTEGTAFCADSSQLGSDFSTANCESTADCSADEVCVHTCLPGTRCAPLSAQCDACPSGQVLCNGSCVSNNCGNRGILDPTTCTCVCDPAFDRCKNNTDPNFQGCCPDPDGSIGCVPLGTVCIPPTCAQNGSDCSDNRECCSGICTNGTCFAADCPPDTKLCSNGQCAECCADTDCSGCATCQFGTCACPAGTERVDTASGSTCARPCTTGAECLGGGCFTTDQGSFCRPASTDLVGECPSGSSTECPAGSLCFLDVGGTGGGQCQRTCCTADTDCSGCATCQFGTCACPAGTELVTVNGTCRRGCSTSDDCPGDLICQASDEGGFCSTGGEVGSCPGRSTACPTGSLCVPPLGQIDEGQCLRAC